MLYEIAHYVKEKFPFIWNSVEWGNSVLFSLAHRNGLKKIPALLEECSRGNPVAEGLTVRLARVDDVPALVKFFAEQTADTYTFFTPHGFDERSVRKVVLSRSFLTFVAVWDGAVVGYFFLRCYMNKCFKGYIVDYRYRCKRIGTLEGVVMNRVAELLNLRIFGSISPLNMASMATAKAVNELKVIKKLENDYFYIEFLPKGKS